MASYHHTIVDTPVQAVFGREIIFNLMPVVECQVITAKKQWQVNIDNSHKNSRQVSHDYAIYDIVYVDMTGI